MNEVLTWVGIVLCMTQSASFSGLNLAVFTPSRLWLETTAAAGNAQAARVLELRRDANYTLVTILCGNVAINVLLTLLTESVMAGLMAFFFSTAVITTFGEILPQAFFARHAVPMAARLAPLLWLYRTLLWSVARPLGKLLDLWIGPEGIRWMRETELRDVLLYHANYDESEVSRLEATGAINFLALDDLPAEAEGSPLDPRSVIRLPMQDGRPVFPHFERSPRDPFLRQIGASGKKWSVLIDAAGVPRFVIDTHAFLRGALFDGPDFDPVTTCHHPLVVSDRRQPLGQALSRLTVRPQQPEDDLVDVDVILLWTPAEHRIITGADILGRLLRGITRIARSVSIPGKESTGVARTR